VEVELDNQPDEATEVPPLELDPVLADEADWLDEPDEVPAAEALDAPPEPLVAPPPAPSPARPEPRDFETDDIFPDDTPEPALEEEEDVLEETPEFLQETPEHERLWFEQKPPRDFDFGS
jgi:hypothetical protein